MPGVNRFEDLVMWQRARRLANLIYRLTGESSFRDPDLRSQMRRAAVSVMSNVAEGFGRGSNEELLYFLYIAKGSLAEVQSQLYLSADLRYIPSSPSQEAQKECDETARLIQAFARSMKAAGKTGFRHKRAQIPWAERVQQVMREITEDSKDD
jgi:four helix bundle protein